MHKSYRSLTMYTGIQRLKLPRVTGDSIWCLFVNFEGIYVIIGL